MNYSKAKLAAYDHSITDWRYLREASVFLLGRLNATEEDISDAGDLVRRAIKLQLEETPKSDPIVKALKNHLTSP